MIYKVITNENDYLDKKNSLKKFNENTSWENINKNLKKSLNDN